MIGWIMIMDHKQEVSSFTVWSDVDKFDCWTWHITPNAYLQLSATLTVTEEIFISCHLLREVNRRRIYPSSVTWTLGECDLGCVCDVFLVRWLPPCLAWQHQHSPAQTGSRRERVMKAAADVSPPPPPSSAPNVTLPGDFQMTQTRTIIWWNTHWGSGSLPHAARWARDAFNYLIKHDT